MNIAVDIDDTITNTYETLLPLIAIHYNLDLKKLWKTLPSYKELSKLPDYDKFIKDHYHILANIVDVKKDAIEVLRQLRLEGNKIYIITARNTEEYGNPYKISYDFLTKKGIPFDKLITNVDNKGMKCISEGIDVFLDDSTKNCKSALKYNINTYQFKTQFVSGDPNIKKINSWNDFYKAIHKLKVES